MLSKVQKSTQRQMIVQTYGIKDSGSYRNYEGLSESGKSHGGGD